jgi:hypothetical protein
VLHGTEQPRHLLPAVMPEIQLRLSVAMVQTLGLDEHPEALAPTVHPPPQPIRADHAFLPASEVRAQDERLGVYPEQLGDGLLVPRDAGLVGSDHVILGHRARVGQRTEHVQAGLQWLCHVLIVPACPALARLAVGKARRHGHSTYIAYERSLATRDLYKGTGLLSLLSASCIAENE